MLHEFRSLEQNIHQNKRWQWRIEINQNTTANNHISMQLGKDTNHNNLRNKALHIHRLYWICNDFKKKKKQQATNCVRETSRVRFVFTAIDVSGITFNFIDEIVFIVVCFSRIRNLAYLSPSKPSK